MLRRLGHQPLVCICDNGSEDGTPSALRDLEAEFEDIPLHLILNPKNLGSSIARNQIIDYVLAAGADYLLFMDGDIEVVPFSSFSMLRYMENQGSQLGCIGAHSQWQTLTASGPAAQIYGLIPNPSSPRTWLPGLNMACSGARCSTLGYALTKMIPSTSPVGASKTTTWPSRWM